MKIDYFKIKRDYFKSYVNQFNKPNVLFIWIPKNAGTSVHEEMHKLFGMDMILSFIEAKNRFANRGMVTFGHMNVNQLIDKEIINRNYFEKAYVFSICRNPFDRFVSLLHYLKKMERIPKNYMAIDLINDVVRGIDPVGLYNYRGLSQCNKQVDWIDNLNVDKILRFENLATEMNALSKVTGKDLNLIHMNKSNNRKTASEELDAQTIKLIKEYYEPDFLRFNYSMNINPK